MYGLKPDEQKVRLSPRLCLYFEVSGIKDWGRESFLIFFGYFSRGGGARKKSVADVLCVEIGA